MGACSCSNQAPESGEKLLPKPPVNIQNFKDKAKEWNLTSSNIDLAFEEAQEDNLSLSKPMHYEDVMKLFLYGKRLLPSVPQTRQASVNLLLGDKTGKAYERLKRIVLIGEVSSDDTKAFVTFLSTHPAWGGVDSWVAFRDHPLLKNKPSAYVERIQSDNGLSYLNAPIVLQHYLVSMQLDSLVGMVDLVKYLRQSMGHEELKNHIVHGFGQSSLVFLQHLFPASSVDSFLTVEVKNPEVTKFLQEYGPALVTGFGVRPDFQDEKNSVFVNISSAEAQGNHALLLIGFRREYNELRFLLQNWWTSKPFVEVSVGYLAACGASLTFSTIPRLEIPTSFHVNSKRHVEVVHDVRERT